jgi:hypoxanthine phosphoribosyltransferase
MQPKSHKTLISAAEIDSRVRQLAATINRDYQHSNDLVLVCVLTGAKPFFDALTKALDIPHRRAAIQVSSYGVGTYTSTGDVMVKQPLNVDVNGADVLVVEDIIDTGYSMRTVINLIEDAGAASTKVCALLSKPSRRVVPVREDYLGFNIDDYFVFGYGIDVDQQYRELSYIGYFE